MLDEFEGVTSVFKNVASGILADKPTFDNGSIKLGTDVDVAVMGNDYFDFNSVQLVVASSDTELKTYDIQTAVGRKRHGQCRLCRHRLHHIRL